MSASITNITKRIYINLWNLRGEFLKRSVLPVVSLAVLILVFDDDIAAYKAIVAFVIAMVTMATFTVSWHRLILIGKQVADSPLSIRFGVAEAKTIGCLFLFKAIDTSGDILLGVVTPQQSIVGYALIAIFYLSIAYVMLRLLFVYPIIALNEKDIFNKAWLVGRGKILKLSGIMFLSILPLLAMMILVVVLEVLHRPESMIIVFPIYYVAGIAILATALSTMYKEIEVVD